MGNIGMSTRMCICIRAQLHHEFYCFQYFHISSSEKFKTYLEKGMLHARSQVLDLSFRTEGRYRCACQTQDGHQPLQQRQDPFRSYDGHVKWCTQLCRHEFQFEAHRPNGWWKYSVLGIWGMCVCMLLSTILFHTILFHTMLSHTVLCYTHMYNYYDVMICNVILLLCPILCFAILCYAILDCTSLYYTILYSTTLYYILFYTK